MAYKLNVTEHADELLELLFFDIRGDIVNVLGIFHQLESYQTKL